MSSILGKAKPNQLAKFITPPFSGKILQRWGRRIVRALREEDVLGYGGHGGHGAMTYELIWPCRMRLGVVPVNVAVPPILAE